MVMRQGKDLEGGTYDLLQGRLLSWLSPVEIKEKYRNLF
jgi:hypothetical protein